MGHTRGGKTIVTDNKDDRTFQETETKVQSSRPRCGTVSGNKSQQAQTNALRTEMSQDSTPHIESGLLGAGFWAKCGKIYAGGYRTERGAINAVKRKLESQTLTLAKIQNAQRSTNHSTLRFP
jgi:hypothetical protein